MAYRIRSRRRAVHAGLLLIGAACTVAACGGNDGPSDSELSISFCSDNAPQWIAFQDGDGPWTHVNPGSGLTYTYTFTSGRGGVAIVPSSQDALIVNYGTVAQLSTIRCTTGSKTVTGDIGGLGGTLFATVDLGTSSALVPSGESAYTLTQVPDGKLPFLAILVAGGATVPSSLVIRHKVDAANNGVLHTNFGVEGIAPAIATFRLTGLDGGNVVYVASEFYGYQMASQALLSYTESYAANPDVDKFAAVPVDSLYRDEVQFLSGQVNDPQGARLAGLYFAEATDLSLAFGPVLSTPVVTTATTTPYLRPRVVLTTQPNYDRMVFASYFQSTRAALVSVSAEYLRETPTAWDVIVPDVSGAEGWDNSWGLVPGAATDWEVQAQGGKNPALNEAVSPGDYRWAAATGSSIPAVRNRGAASLSTGGRRAFLRLPFTPPIATR